MPERNRKFYLDDKLSTIEFFRQDVRWVQKSATKESQFEKPYLDDEYRKMHLEWPQWKWPSYQPRDFGPFGELPEGGGRKFYEFDPPVCFMFVYTPDCDEGADGYATLNLIPPRSFATQLVWRLEAKGPIKIEPSRPQTLDVGDTFRFHIDLMDKDFTDPIPVRVTVQLQGEVDEVVGSTGVLVGDGYNRREVGYEDTVALTLESYRAKVIDCGLQSIDFACVGCDCSAGLTWDEATSADSVAREGSCTVAITEYPACGPFTWSVSGTGFTLAYATTEGYTNTLSADNTACGVANITVTGCDGVTQVVGYVKCTEGTYIECGYYYAYGDPNYCFGWRTGTYQNWSSGGGYIVDDKGIWRLTATLFYWNTLYSLDVTASCGGYNLSALQITGEFLDDPSGPPNIVACDWEGTAFARFYYWGCVPP